VDKAHDGFDGSGLARTIASDETHDIALFEVKRDVFEV
jgi:hypothetical protein